MAYDRDGDEKSPAENAKRTAMAVSQAAIASKKQPQKQPLGVSLAEGPAGDHPPVPAPHLGRGGVAVPKPEGK